MAEFTISQLPAGVGEIGIAPAPGRSGGYATDLDAVIAWQPRLVLTMTTEAELRLCGAESFGKDLAATGIGWRHLPIADYGTPDQATAALWPEASQAALVALESGARVLVHCHGGCGRSGMAALRLLVETGEPPGPALHRLRLVRPCAVETRAQLHWALLPEG